MYFRAMVDTLEGVGSVRGPDFTVSGIRAIGKSTQVFGFV